MYFPMVESCPARGGQLTRAIDESDLASLVEKGQLVFVPGSTGIPQAFMDALYREPARTEGLKLMTSCVPGINRLDVDAMASSAQVTGLFMQRNLAGAQRDRRYRVLPMSYSGFVRHLKESVEIDLAVIQVSSPDAFGRCSLGLAAEFTPIALGKSRRVLGVINHAVPRLRGAPSVGMDDLDYVCEVSIQPPVYLPGVDDVSNAISSYIAPFIDDGCVLQAGLGKVPTALMRLLGDRRRLRLHSGMLSDGLIDLANAGALDLDFLHTACVLVGSEAFYQWVPEFAPLRVAGCEATHHPDAFAGLDRFVAVNAALEVDLFGQCNLEHADGRAISGPGGAPDFARAARQSRGGKSIVVLGATHAGKTGDVSRIVPSLDSRSMATLSRVDVDAVITEYGVARLEGACVHERAEALIGVAAPAFRPELERAWREIAARL